MGKSKGQQKEKLQRKKKLLQTKPISIHRRSSKILIGLCLIVITFLIYWPVRNHEFLNYDDNEYVTENPQVQRGLTLKGLIWAFTTTHAANWHPLTWLSHMVDCEAYGLNPGGHHLTSLLFHIANTLLLFFLLHRMTMGLWASGFVAALFALHPLHVESVVWVAERKDVLSTFFWMLSVWAYVRYVERPRQSRYLLVVLFFVLGLLTKPMVVTLPFVLLLLDYWPLDRFRFDAKLSNPKPIDFSEHRFSAVHLVLEKVPLFLLSAISSSLTYFAQQEGGAIKSFESYLLATRVVNALVSYISYIGKMIWPHRLAVFYPYPDMLPMWQVAGSVLLLLCISILVIRYARKHPYLLVGWLWYLGTLVPVIGLVQVGGQAMADRYTYISFIGLFIMVANGIPALLESWQYRKVLFGLTAGLLLIILMVITRLQINHWQNNFTLFQHALGVTSKNSLAHYNLGVNLAKQGRYEEAIAHYTEALRIAPHNPDTHNNLGVILARQGRYQEAVAHFTKALQIKPDLGDAHNNLGGALARQGRYQEAIAHYTEALRINPKDSKANYNLAIALARQGRYQEASAHYAEVLRIDPYDGEVHNNLGVALFRQGKHQEAITHFVEALRIKPDFAEAYGNLGNTFADQGSVEEAIDQYKKALRIKPDFAEVHFSLGLAYLMIGNRSSAMEEYKILKTLNPDLANKLYQKISK